MGVPSAIFAAVMLAAIVACPSLASAAPAAGTSALVTAAAPATSAPPSPATASPAKTAAATSAPAAKEVVIVVFPFTSPGDGGAAGRQFAENLRMRAARLGLTTVDPLSLKEAMADTTMPTLDTTAAQMAQVLKDRFAARLGVWGEVRPQGEGLTMEVRGLDTERTADDPDAARAGLTLAKTYRAAQPQLVNPAQDEILLDLSGRRKPAVPEANPERDAKVPTVGPELVKNGGFEAGDKTPDGWQRIDGLTTFWVAGPTGKCLKINTDVYENQWNDWQKKFQAGATADQAPEARPTSGAKYDTVAGNYGVAFDSDPIPVVPGKTYKVTIGYRGKTDELFFPKLFIRGWGTVDGQKRVLYDAYLAMRSKSGGKEWESNVRLITIPADTKWPIEFVKLKIYAYWPPGTYYFDNVSLKEAAR
jgi:hypothetical protein